MHPTTAAPESASRPDAKLPVPAEVVEWARANYDEEEVAAGMADIRAGRGCSISDLLATPAPAAPAPPRE